MQSACGKNSHVPDKLETGLPGKVVEKGFSGTVVGRHWGGQIWRPFHGGQNILQKITINVPLFKKMRDIIFFLRDNNFLSRFEGHFEGAKTFLTP
jgi:hypothetical protein